MTKHTSKKTIALAVHKSAGTGTIALVHEGARFIREGLTRLADAMGGDALTKTPQAVVANIYNYINKDWMKVLESYKKILNTHLMELIVTSGHPNEKDPKHVTELLVEHRDKSFLLQRKAYKSKLPDPGKLHLMSGLAYEKFCDTTLSYTPNPVKLKQCVDDKLLTEEQIELARDDMPVALWVTEE